MKRGALILAASALVFAGAVANARLVPPTVSSEAILEDRLPPTLEEFGFFVDGPNQIPTMGVIPYRLNTPLYSDGAEKLRFVYVPSGEKVPLGDDGLLQLPVGSALIKTFAFGDGDARRLIETRVLLHRADGWLALPYRWNDEQTEARLAVAGARLPITTPAGEKISYRIPNKNQCKECHGLNGTVTPIGPKARNLSQDWMSARADWFEATPRNVAVVPLWDDASAGSAEERARGYLDVNCAHCHRPGATASNSGLDLRWDQADPQSFGVHKRPVAAGRGAGSHEFSIEPGKPDDSIIVYRMSSTEPGVAMPELGKATVDREGVEAVRRWIASMEARR